MKVDMLVIARDNDLTTVVVVADMDVVIGAGDYDVVVVPTCLRGRTSQP